MTLTETILDAFRSAITAPILRPFWALGLVLPALLIGCSSPDAERSTPGKPPSAGPHSRSRPIDLLQSMVEKYQQAKAYSDRGRLSLSFVRDGRMVRQPEWNAAVQFVRPGRLRVDAYNLTLASDAQSQQKLLLARVEDAESNNIDNQVVIRAAPERISLESLAADSILYSQLTGRIQGPPVQLELLLAEKPLATLFGNDAHLEWLDDASIEGVLCRRIKATTPQGEFVFWIDPDELLLRRLEYPAKDLLPDLASDPQISEASLVADLVGATFRPKIESLEFTFPVPASAKRVRAFVLPPVLVNSELLNKQLPYEFVELSGKRITPQTTDPKITALFWYAHHPVCEKPAQEFAKAAEQLGEQIRAIAVCTESTEVGDKAVSQQFAAWGVPLTPARDLKDYRSRVFQISQLPAVTLLDEQGRFQWMASGPSAAVDLPIAVARMLKGENLAALAQEQDKLLREQYDRLIAAGGPQIDEGILSASSPQQLKLNEKWKVGDLPSPAGLVSAGNELDELYVVAGSHSIWRVDHEGTVVAKHDIELPEGAEITSLRTCTDKQGKRYFAAFSPQKPGIRVFNAHWRSVFTYPPDGSDSLAIRDAQFADSDHDGQPELFVAFTESAGLHAVNLTGERIWSNQAYVPLLSVAVAHDVPDVELGIYVTGRGGVCEVFKYGNEPPKDVPGWALAHLFTSQFVEPTQAAYLAIGMNNNQEPCAVGLNLLLKEMWSYPLSGSMFKQPVDFVTSGNLRANSQGEWIIAWGDGAVHIISEDGEFDDMFHTGQEIRGVALLESSGRPLLVVSTETGLIAWEVSE